MMRFTIALLGACLALPASVLEVLAIHDLLSRPMLGAQLSGCIRTALMLPPIFAAGVALLLHAWKWP